MRSYTSFTMEFMIVITLPEIAMFECVCSSFVNPTKSWLSPEARKIYRFSSRKVEFLPPAWALCKCMVDSSVWTVLSSSCPQFSRLQKQTSSICLCLHFQSQWLPFWERSSQDNSRKSKKTENEQGTKEGRSKCLLHSLQATPTHFVLHKPCPSSLNHFCISLQPPLLSCSNRFLRWHPRRRPALATLHRRRRSRSRAARRSPATRRGTSTRGSTPTPSTSSASSSRSALEVQI